ncbi:MAG: hypothetical protein HY351_05630 [Candidatus Omnitrophica bacterium]|nr:hypothetical protein [Candidatus Omnitrophota bacterium]
MKLRRFLFAFGFGALFGCTVLGGVFLYSGVFELPVAVSKALSIQPKTFPIQMKVNFGSADKPAYDETIYVEKGTTPKEAVSQVFPVLSGKSCCSLKEVSEIGGIRVDPSKNHWWICLVNGSKNVSPQKKRLKLGDVVEWKYIQDA